MFDDTYNGLSLDDAAAKAGGYVHWYPGKKFIVEHDYRAAIDYCKGKGIKTSDLTEEDWDQFKLPQPNVDRHDRSSSEDKKLIAEAISILAGEIWREHYTPIIGAEQVEYMLTKFQSAEQIASDINENGYVYFTAKCEENDSNEEIIGYCAVIPREDCLFLSKMYVKREYRGIGIARRFMNEVHSLCRAEYGFSKIRLTVNKHNSRSIAAYKRMGFETVDSVITEIGGGFIMDDYVMECRCMRNE